MTASSRATDIDRINFLLEGAALARANALADEIPADLRRMWLEDADHMTQCAHRLIDERAIKRWMTGLPAWELAA